MKNAQTHRGFTLIEVMVVVAIVAILAALALPAYQRYVVRAKMADALALLDSARPQIEEYYDVQGRMPMTEADLGLDFGRPVDDIVDSVLFAGDGQGRDGTIYALLRNGVVNGLTSSDGAFGLRATPHPDGHLTWECVRIMLPAEYLPATCREKM